MSSIPIPSQNNSPVSPGEKMNLYARAAANLYGVINFDDFFKILDMYYGEGTLSKEKVMFFLWTAKEPDPMYYVKDELIVHSSIPSNEADIMYKYLQRRGKADSRVHGQRCILPEKDFLRYADPSFYDETESAKEMERFLEKDLGLNQEDVRDIVTEIDFLCRSGACPTFVMDVLKRRDLLPDQNHEMDLITQGSMMEGQTRMWERLGFTGEELLNRC